MKLIFKNKITKGCSSDFLIFLFQMTKNIIIKNDILKYCTHTILATVKQIHLFSLIKGALAFIFKLPLHQPQ